MRLKSSDIECYTDGPSGGIKESFILTTKPVQFEHSENLISKAAIHHA